MNLELIKQFAQLLESKDRRRINEWKRDHRYRYWADEWCPLNTDFEVIEDLLKETNIVENYIEYLEVDFRFKHYNSKQKFINDFKTPLL